MNIEEQLESQLNPIIIGLNFKINALISVLSKEQLSSYKTEIDRKKQFIRMKLSDSLTEEQLHSILEHLD